MEKRIKDRYNDQILLQAMQAFNIQERHIRLLDGFESFIYEFERNEERFILRIGHSLRRNENLICGEVDWINYLYTKGASVARAIQTIDGTLVSPIPDGRGGHFLATAFEKADGRHPRDVDWNEALFERYGRLLGRMHSLSKEYLPLKPAWKRPEWDDPGMLDVEGWLPESEYLVLEKFRYLKTHLEEFPKSSDSYGLIHQDAHAGNMFVDKEGKITLFDFDDCTYSWYINDIAIVLFYLLVGKEDSAAFTKKIMPQFLRGYKIENQFDEHWLEELPYFLKLREIDLYAVIHRSFDVDNIDHPWVAMFMQERKHRIENEVPFLDFDFSIL